MRVSRSGVPDVDLRVRALCSHLRHRFARGFLRHPDLDPRVFLKLRDDRLAPRQLHAANDVELPLRRGAVYRERESERKQPMDISSHADWSSGRCRAGRRGHIAHDNPERIHRAGKIAGGRAVKLVY